MSISNHPESQTAATLPTGVLSEWIVQPSDTSPHYDVDGGMSFTFVAKGPYVHGKDYNEWCGKPLNTVLANESLNFSENFQPPVPPADYVWVVKSTRVEELEAGDHCVLRVECEAELLGQITPGQDGWIEDPMQDNWSVRWQAYTLTPYAFCSNKLHVDPPCPQTTDPTLSGYAMREHIMKFLDDKKSKTENGHRAYNDGTGQWRFLNDAEDLVCDKVVKNTNALYHYPVLVHQTVTTKPFDTVSGVIDDHTVYRSVIGLSVDYEVTSEDAELSGCPFEFPERYTFVKQGDDITRQKSTNPPQVRFIRTQTYQGMLSADKNYYGHEDFDHDNLSGCRWKVASV